MDARPVYAIESHVFTFSVIRAQHAMIMITTITSAATSDPSIGSVLYRGRITGDWLAAPL
jgi:hypothetical protein